MVGAGSGCGDGINRKRLAPANGSCGLGTSVRALALLVGSSAMRLSSWRHGEMVSDVVEPSLLSVITYVLTFRVGFLLNMLSGGRDAKERSLRAAVCIPR